MKITTYFSNLKSANEAVEKLKSEGIKNAYVDANDHYTNIMNAQTNLPGASFGENLSNLVLNSGDNNIDQDVSPLTAANPMVSGMGNTEEITDINCSVHVEADDDNLNTVKNIIKDMGGLFEDPGTDGRY